MIFIYILQFISLVFSTLFAWLPVVTELPFNIGTYISDGMGYFFFLMGFIPIMFLFWEAFKFIMWWKVLLMTLRFLRILK